MSSLQDSLDQADAMWNAAERRRRRSMEIRFHHGVDRQFLLILDRLIQSQRRARQDKQMEDTQTLQAMAEAATGRFSCLNCKRRLDDPQDVVDHVERYPDHFLVQEAEFAVNYRAAKEALTAQTAEVASPCAPMRTIPEILTRIQEIKNADFFGTIRSELIHFLPYAAAKPFLNVGVTPEQWDPHALTRESILAKIADYMSFAWENANGCRGLSAQLSINHMSAWLWLLNDGSLEQMEQIEYEHYGKERLIFVCDHAGLNWKQWDDGISTNGK